MRALLLALIAACGSAARPAPQVPVVSAVAASPSPWLESPIEVATRTELFEHARCYNGRLVFEEHWTSTTRVIVAASCFQPGLSRPSPGVECAPPRHRVVGYVELERDASGRLALAPNRK